MAVRARMLPDGWYPSSATEAGTILHAWSKADGAVRFEGALAAIGPHAGWYYSGRIAWSAWRAAAQADAIMIVGGHLPAGSAFRYYAEEGFQTPLGIVMSDEALTSFVAAEIGALPDTKSDNTVEIHLPMAAERFPGHKVACFRAPNDESAAVLGAAVARYSEASGRSVFVMGSTDLTHYGRVYGFEPGGPAPEGFMWARRIDESIVESFVDMDAAEALRKADSDGSACSVGAAIAAIAYARCMGASSGRLLMRGSSDEIAHDNASSVGYCSVGYYR